MALGLAVVAAAAAASSSAAASESAGAGPCLPADGVKVCPDDSIGFVYALSGQLVCNCANGSASYGVVGCANTVGVSITAYPPTLPRCDAAVVPQAPMPCAAGNKRCPTKGSWFQSNQINVCFCEGGLEKDDEYLYCNQGNVSQYVNPKSLPNCAAEPAWVKHFPCKANGQLCASGWVLIREQVVCNCVNPQVSDSDYLTCSGQNVPVEQLGLCSQGEPTPPPTPTPVPTLTPTIAPTTRTLPPVPQVACNESASSMTGNTTGLCYLPSADYCCFVDGNKWCSTSASGMTCGYCACADPDTGAAARPASGAAAQLAALLLLAALL